MLLSNMLKNSFKNMLGEYEKNHIDFHMAVKKVHHF